MSAPRSIFVGITCRGAIDTSEYNAQPVPPTQSRATSNEATPLEGLDIYRCRDSKEGCREPETRYLIRHGGFRDLLHGGRRLADQNAQLPDLIREGLPRHVEEGG